MQLIYTYFASLGATALHVAAAKEYTKVIKYVDFKIYLHFYQISHDTNKTVEKILCNM